MATIERRPNGSYLITVSSGYDGQGKQVRQRMTITADDLTDITDRQIQKTVNEKAVLFEKRVKDGKILDGERLTFAEFVERWLKDYAEKQLAPKTFYENKKLLDLRILPALGHMRIGKIKPAHLISFYNNLAETGIRLDSRFKLIDPATPIPEDIDKRVRDRLADGLATRKDAAVKVSAAIGQPLEKLFAPAGPPRPLSDKTIKNYHSLLSTIFSAAVQWQIIEDNPCGRVKPPKKQNQFEVTDDGEILDDSDLDSQILDDSNLAAMLEALVYQPLKYHLAVIFGIKTGCRLGEIMGITWNDIDFQKKTVRITKAAQYLPDRGNFIKLPKTKKSIRTISISALMLALLGEYRAEQIINIEKMGDLWQGSPLREDGAYDGRLFTQLDGAPVYVNAVSAWFSKFLKNNNIPHIRFHDLRHLSGSILISEGMDIVTVSKRLGHA